MKPCSHTPSPTRRSSGTPQKRGTPQLYVRTHEMKNSNSLLMAYHKRKVRVTLWVVNVSGLAAVVFALSSASNASLCGNVFALVVLLDLLWLGYAATCPKCNLRILFQAMSSQSAGQWLHWSLQASECPRCGHMPEPKK